MYTKGQSHAIISTLYQYTPHVYTYSQINVRIHVSMQSLRRQYMLQYVIRNEVRWPQNMNVWMNAYERILQVCKLSLFCVGGKFVNCNTKCLSVCGSVRLLAAFGSSAKLCPEHSYAPAKGTSFENGGIKRVKIRLRSSSLSSLNLWFCELVGKDQRWSKYQSVPRDSRLILQLQKTGLRVARGRLAWGIASVVIACHASLSLLQAYSKSETDQGDRWLPCNAFADGTRGSQQSKARMLNLVEIAMMDWH